MAWVEEALGRGIVANREAEAARIEQDRARQNQDLDRIQARDEAKADLGLAERRELAWLKGLLQTAGVADLLADIQRVVGGGDIVDQSYTYFGWKDTSWKVWTALGFVKSEVVDQATYERSKGRRLTKFKLSRIAVGAANIKSGDLHEVGFYVISGTGTGDLTEQDVFSIRGRGNIPTPLRLLSKAPLVVKRELSFVHLGNDGDQPLSATHYNNETTHRLILQNGRVNPLSFDLSPNAGVSTQIINLTDSVADRARLVELLGEGLRRIV